MAAIGRFGLMRHKASASGSSAFAPISSRPPPIPGPSAVAALLVVPGEMPLAHTSKYLLSLYRYSLGNVLKRVESTSARSFKLLV